MIKAFSSVLYIGLCCYTLGQISISGGTGILNGVGTGSKPLGFHLGLELPRSSDLTFYVRGAAYLPSGGADTNYANMTAISLTTVPYTLTVPYQNRSSTYYFEGGTRSYMLNDYDNGFGLYGGSVLGVGINQTRKEYEDYDWEGKYLPSNGDERKGNYYYLALGIQGGMKYTIPIRGTIYFDMTGTYSVLGFANNATGNSSLTYSPLNFLFSLGYRRDLY
ncbi:MAG: hypothetical protein FJY06_05130 [Bacteroidetes bacterium]|nr:hypothetical protein [Bacteroidota bacterium]